MASQVHERPTTPLSPAQNSQLRRGSELFAGYIDRRFGPELSANDISHLGTQLIMEAINTLYSSPYPIFTPRRTKRAVLAYGRGMLADVADGIRARRVGGSPEGQLVDVSADRAKEFYQLYIRGILRLKKHPTEGLTTLAAAHACILPSIGRAEAEIKGEIVEENAKGAMSWRTRRLAGSLIEDRLLARRNASFLIDEEILNTSLDIYQERKREIDVENLKINKENTLQQKAVERWLQLVQLFQEEYAIIQHTLSPEQKQAYDAFLHAQKIENEEYGLEKYLSIDVEKLRQQYSIPNYAIHLPTIPTR